MRVVIATVLFGLVLTNQAALACSCVDPRGLSILPNNVAVVGGKVTGYENWRRAGSFTQCSTCTEHESAAHLFIEPVPLSLVLPVVAR